MNRLIHRIVFGTSVNTLDPSSASPPQRDWHKFAELKLAVDLNIPNSLQTWLPEALAPLTLHAEFLEKILKSAQEATTRILQSEVGAQHQHIHLLIFISASSASQKQTWGFFRIEKLENNTASEARLDHAIEFYLYVEQTQANTNASTG